MKRLLFLNFILLTVLYASAQRIEVKNEVINVGQVMFRQPVVAEYELKNKAAHFISIEKVYSSCGCTTVDYPQGSIRSDSSFIVRAVYDAKQMGHFEKQIGIYTSDSQEPVILTIKGVVVDEVVDYVGDYPYQLGDLMADQNSIEFDDVSRGDRPMAKIHIMNPTDTIVQPVVMHLPNYISAEISPTKIRPGRSGVALLTLDTRSIRNYGLTKTAVFLGRQPGDKVAMNKAINVSAVLLPDFSGLTQDELNMAPKIQLSTTKLNLGSFGTKKKLKGEIEIMNAGKSRLDISDLQMFTIGLQVSLNKTKLQPGEYAKLKIEAVKKDFQLANNPRVLMITNDPNSPKVIIEIKAE